MRITNNEISVPFDISLIKIIKKTKFNDIWFDSIYANVYGSEICLGIYTSDRCIKVMKEIEDAFQSGAVFYRMPEK